MILQSSLERAAGITLIEVMVTLIILSVSMLGIVHMQVLALKSGSHAHARSQARLIGDQLADQLLSTREVVSGEPRIRTNITDDDYITFCDEADDLRDYVTCFDHLAGLLPGGDSTVTGDRNNHRYTFEIRWSENRSARHQAAISRNDCDGDNLIWVTTESEDQNGETQSNSRCMNRIRWNVHLHPHSRFIEQ